MKTTIFLCISFMVTVSVLCNLESQEKTNKLHLRNNYLDHSHSRVRRQNPMEQGKQTMEEKMKEFAEKGKQMMGGGFPQSGPTPPSFMKQGLHA